MPPSTEAIVVRAATPESNFWLRMPSSLSAQLERLAQGQHRSVNAQIVFVLEEYNEARDGRPRIQLRPIDVAAPRRARFRSSPKRTVGGEVRRTIRLPRDLHIRFVDFALMDCRSLNAQMIAAIEWFVSKQSND